MSAKSFPTILCLSCRSLTTNTLKMTTTKSTKSNVQSGNRQIPKPVEPKAIEEHNAPDTLPLKAVCPYCNGYVSDIDTFCIHCGKEFFETAGYYCLSCGKDVEKNARVCRHCGRALNAL